MQGTKRHQQNRAVSPVIGVILMVAITVILAAVIGAFVLQIGNQQETAPMTSLETSEVVKTFKGREVDSYNNCHGTCETNLTKVTVSHVSGDTLDIDSINLKVNGNDSVWGDPERIESYNDDCASYCDGQDDPTIVPQPNALETRGTNQEITFSSGESWEIVGFGGLPHRSIVPQQISSSNRRLQWALRDGGAHYCPESKTGHYSNGNDVAYDAPPYNPTIAIWFDPSNTGSCQDDLDSGDEITVVWKSDSGGKTQKLLGYTVQQSNANT